MYVDELCGQCASKHGYSMPHSHIASFHEGICDACGHWQIICSARDYRYPKIKKINLDKETIERIVSELKEVRLKYSCQGNASAVDEIDSQITAILDKIPSKNQA